MRFEENVKIYEKNDKIDDIPYGSRVELKLGDRNYITGIYQGLCGGFAVDISGYIYSLSQIQEIKVNIAKEENLKLGDIVEIVNIEGLNRVLYSNYPKGFSKKLIGLQGKITMIDKVTDKNIIYYLVDFSVGNSKIHDMRYFVDSRAIFLEGNLKLIKEDENIKMNDDWKTWKVGNIVQVLNINDMIFSDKIRQYIGREGRIISIEYIPSILKTIMLIKIGETEYQSFYPYNLKLVKKENDIKVDKSRFFNPSDIKQLNYKDLDGKTLRMTVVDNEECLMVAGVDKETNTIYMLHSEVKQVRL